MKKYLPLVILVGGIMVLAVFFPSKVFGVAWILGNILHRR